jgi:hypothetical protein
MSGSDQDRERAIRERAYFMWQSEGHPEGRAHEHWVAATVEEMHEQRWHEDALLDDEEKVLAGRADANFPALLTKDVHGG